MEVHHSGLVVSGWRAAQRAPAAYAFPDRHLDRTSYTVLYHMPFSAACPWPEGWLAVVGDGPPVLTTQGAIADPLVRRRLC